MKTNHLLLMAMTALLTASCSQNEIMEVSPDAAPPVGFNVYATAQTRGTETDNTTIGTGIKSSTVGFGVLAYYTGQTEWKSATDPTEQPKPNFMWNQEVKWNTLLNPDAWNYAPVKYWPNTDGDKISFFAYAPYETAPTTASGNTKGIVLSTAAATGYPTLTFTVNSDASKMVDLVATNAGQSTAGTDKTMNLTKTIGKVPFKFLHVLTKLNFEAKLASDLAALNSDETRVFVKSIKLLGTSAEAPALANNNSVFYRKATYKFQDGTWDCTTSGKFEKQGAAIILDAALFAGEPHTFGIKDSEYITSSVAITSLNNAVSLFKANQSLFLIPPTNTGITTENSVRVLITYDVVTIDKNLTDKKSVVETKAVVSLPVGTMKKGVAYKYTFTIGIESVKVDAKVDVWNNPATDVAIPSVNATAGTAAAIGTAIGILSTTKASNPNCNYFVVNVPFKATAASTSLSVITDNFKSGDKIELNFMVATTVSSVSLSGWTASGTLSNAKGKIILTKK